MNTAQAGEKNRHLPNETEADRQARAAFVFFAGVCAVALLVFALMPFIG